MAETMHSALPWRIEDSTLRVVSDGAPKGTMPVADIRGWGYLTGKGHGALGLPEEYAFEIQKANAELIVKAVNAHDDLVKALEQCAAPFSTRPGSVMQCAADIHHEFQRRMDIASEALRAAVGTGQQP